MCGNISFCDPLECEWCAEIDGSGVAIPSFSADNTSCPTGQRMGHVCPPFITKVDKISESEFSDTIVYLIDGDNFVKSNITNFSLRVCNETCQFGGSINK